MGRCNAVLTLSVLLCRWKSVPLFFYLAVCVHFCEGEGVPSFAYAYFFMLCVYTFVTGSMCLLIFIISTLTFRSRSSGRVSFGSYRGMLDCSGLLLGILSRHVSCLNRIKNAIESHTGIKNSLPTRSHKKSSSKSHPVWLRFGGSKRCHLPVICLGKTRRNPNIIIILMFGFLVVFYRETKWPKWTQMANFSMGWRLPGRHRKRCDDVLGANTGLHRGRSADTKHRNSKKKASIGENVAHMTHIGHK